MLSIRPTFSGIPYSQPLALPRIEPTTCLCALRQERGRLQIYFALESETVSMIVCGVRALSLDIGEKRIGIAISDSLQSIAQPLKLYRRGSWAQDIDEVKRLVREHDVSRIVCGLPKNLDGSIGKKAAEIVEFARKLEEKTSVPVDLWDERYSTDEAHRIFDMHAFKQKKRKPYIDMMAAQIILQGFLDAQKKG
jgi:putative holliday junction resolvase